MKKKKLSVGIRIIFWVGALSFICAIFVVPNVVGGLLDQAHGQRAVSSAFLDDPPLSPDIFATQTAQAQTAEAQQTAQAAQQTAVAQQTASAQQTAVAQQTASAQQTAVAQQTASAQQTATAQAQVPIPTLSGITPTIKPSPGVTPTLTKTATATATATKTATATATATETSDISTVTVEAPTSNTPPGGGANIGNVFMLSGGIGLLVVIVTGGIFFVMWKRSQISQPAFAQGRGLAGRFGSSWMSSREIQQGGVAGGGMVNNSGLAGQGGQPGFALANNANPGPGMMPMQQAAPSPGPGAYQQGAFAAQGMMGSSPQHPPLVTSAPNYTPGDLRPITSAFPKHLLAGNTGENNGQAAAGVFHPFAMDTLNLPAELTNKVEKQSAVVQPPTPSGFHPMPSSPDYSTVAEPEEEDYSTVMDEPSSTITGDVVAPSVKDDPVLETVMRQAQIGLFILQGRDQISGAVSNHGLT